MRVPHEQTRLGFAERSVASHVIAGPTPLTWPGRVRPGHLVRYRHRHREVTVIARGHGWLVLHDDDSRWSQAGFPDRAQGRDVDEASTEGGRAKVADAPAELLVMACWANWSRSQRCP